MRIHALFMQRAESYKGQYAPELLEAWDEFTVEQNRSRYEECIDGAKLRHAKLGASFALVEIDVNMAQIRGLCLDTFSRARGKIVSPPSGSPPA